MFDHLLESSHRDDSNNWSNIGFGEEMTQVESIEVNFHCIQVMEVEEMCLCLSNPRQTLHTSTWWQYLESWIKLNCNIDRCLPFGDFALHLQKKKPSEKYFVLKSLQFWKPNSHQSVHIHMTTKSGSSLIAMHIAFRLKGRLFAEYFEKNVLSGLFLEST